MRQQIIRWSITILTILITNLAPYHLSGYLFLVVDLEEISLSNLWHQIAMHLWPFYLFFTLMAVSQIAMLVALVLKQYKWWLIILLMILLLNLILHTDALTWFVNNFMSQERLDTGVQHLSGHPN